MADGVVVGFAWLGVLLFCVHLLCRVYDALFHARREGEREPAPFPEPVAPLEGERMTAEVVELDRFRNCGSVRACQGFIVLCEAITALARFSPAQAEYYATELTKAGFITPGEQHVIYSLIAMERRDRPRAQGPLPKGWMAYEDTERDGGPGAA